MKPHINAGLDSGFVLEFSDKGLYTSPNGYKGLVDMLFYRSIRAFTEDYVRGFSGLHLHFGIRASCEVDEQR